MKATQPTLCTIFEAAMVDVNNPENTIDKAMCIKARPLVDTSDAPMSLLDSDGTLNFGVVNMSSFANTFNTVLFPKSLDIQAMMQGIVEEQEELKAIDAEYIKVYFNVWLAREKMEAPEMYVMRYATESNSHILGDYVTESDGTIKVFDTIAEIITCDKDGNFTENLEKKCMRRWNTSLQLNNVLGFAVWQTYADFLSAQVALSDVDTAPESPTPTKVDTPNSGLKMPLMPAAVIAPKPAVIPVRR